MPTTNAPAQIATAAGLSQQATVSFSSVNAGLASAQGIAGLAGTTSTSHAFPAVRLGVRVDLLLAGTWTDITAFVYQRNPLQITGMGRTDWTTTIARVAAHPDVEQPGRPVHPETDRRGVFPEHREELPDPGVPVGDVADERVVFGVPVLR